MVNLPVNTVKSDNQKCAYITVIPKSFKLSLLPTDSVSLDHVVFKLHLNGANVLQNSNLHIKR
jgi:hypothetical protein